MIYNAQYFTERNSNQKAMHACCSLQVPGTFADATGGVTQVHCQLYISRSIRVVLGCGIYTAVDTSAWRVDQHEKCI